MKRIRSVRPVEMVDRRKVHIVRLNRMKSQAQTVRLATTATARKRFKRPSRIVSCDFPFADDLEQSKFSI